MSAQTEETKSKRYTRLFMRTALVSVFLATGLFMLSNLLQASRQISHATEHILVLFALLLFSAYPIYVVFYSVKILTIRVSLTLGVFLLIFHQVIGLIDVMSPGVLRGGPLNLQGFQPLILALGFGTFMASMYFSLMNIVNAQAALRQEQQRLNQEITVRQRAEAELRERDENLRIAQHLSNVGSWKWIVATDTVQWSEELFRINGHDSKLPIPSFAEMSSFFTPESWKRLNEAVTEALHHGASYELDLDLVRTDGIIRKTIARGEVDFDATGKIVGLHGTVQDITERKQAEEHIAYQAHLLANVHDAIIAIDEGLNVTAWNRAAEEMYGWKAEEVLGRNVVGSLRSESTEARLATLLRTLNETGRCRAEGVHHQKDGQPIQVEGTFTALYQANRQMTGYVIVNRDITERKRAEAEKEKLEILNRQLQKSESLGRMAGAIAHNFNNQLHVVTGNLEMALNELPRAAGRPVEFLTDALRAARRASEVSSLMLIYLGQTHDKQEPLDLSAACRQNLPILLAAMPKNVVLDSDLPSPGPVVRSNPNQIQQILTNLVTNAWEAGDEAKCIIHLSVKTALPSDIPELHRFPPTWQPRNNAYACLAVADTGLGIAAKHIDSIFDPFFSSKFPGRGMGLAVVLGNVRAHGGAITVENDPGRGSIFRVYLPLSEAAPAVPVL